MDGNGRWASRLSLPRFAGHQAGAETLRVVVRAAPALGVATLTAYAFSADNWKRPPDEVRGLMALLACYLEGETPRLIESSVRLSVIGRRDRLPAPLLTAIEDAESATAPGTGLHLRLAIDYSSRDAIRRACEFEDLPGLTEPVDLLIRTGGEQRLSDFLLWECAYAELYFTRRMWPEFNEKDLGDAVLEFRRRDRRFGAAPVMKPAPEARERWLS
jgi:undecaprenyl diphosphate synthase